MSNITLEHINHKDKCFYQSTFTIVHCVCLCGYTRVFSCVGVRTCLCNINDVMKKMICEYGIAIKSHSTWLNLEITGGVELTGMWMLKCDMEFSRSGCMEERRGSRPNAGYKYS